MASKVSHPLTPAAAELIARRFAMLAEPMRLQLVDLLSEAGQLSVQELAEALGATHGNVSRHLNLLYAEGIVGRHKEKTRVLYRITDQTVVDLCDQVCAGIERQLKARGEAFVVTEKSEKRS